MMFFNEADELLEFIRGTLPYYVLVFVPILIIISPMTPVDASYDFPAMRMQQYDLHGDPHGCRNSILNGEARLYSPGLSLIRRCVFVKAPDLTYESYLDILGQHVSGLLILIPRDFYKLPDSEREGLMQLEKDLQDGRDDQDRQTNIPVLFVPETKDVLEIYNSLQKSAERTNSDSSAFSGLMDAVFSTGFQITSNQGQSKAITDAAIYNIQGKLGRDTDSQLPTIAVVAYYDTFGVAPALSFGSDSNGSGVAALLELARLFSKLYSTSSLHPKFNMLFLLTGGGKFSYQGTRKWIEENAENSDNGVLQDVVFTLCLDGLGAGDELYLHVSRPPGDNSTGAQVLQDFEHVVNKLNSNVKFGMVHKKINLAEKKLSWEHEIFSMKKQLAFTLSHYQSHKDPGRETIFDTVEAISYPKLKRNIHVVAETISRHLYNVSGLNEHDLFAGSLAVQENNLKHWISYLSAQPRHASLLAKKTLLITTLEKHMQLYLKDVVVSAVKPDAKDPDFVFYDADTAILSAFSVKPAVFDLVLTAAILIYLGLVYLATQNFWMLCLHMQKMSVPVMVANGKSKYH